jgi:hypothetical protein
MLLNKLVSMHHLELDVLATALTVTKITLDAYLAEGQRAAESQHEQSRKTNAELIAKLQRARHASQIPG